MTQDLTNVPLRDYVAAAGDAIVADPSTLTDTHATPLASDKLASFHAAVSARKGVCVLLAAGQGSRFISETPKVIHPFLKKPLAQYSLDAALDMELPVIIVVGHARTSVVKALKLRRNSHVVYVCQDERMGTGHAVYLATRALPKEFDGDILVSYADNPGVDGVLLGQLFEAHAKFRTRYGNGYGAMAVTGSRKQAGEGAAAYGRIVREGKNGTGSVVDIVEKKTIVKLGSKKQASIYGSVSWSAEELEQIDEFNSGIVVARAKPYIQVLEEVLGSLTKEVPEMKYEYYATDFVKRLVEHKFVAEGFQIEEGDIWKVEGANTVEELEELSLKMVKHT